MIEAVDNVNQAQNTPSETELVPAMTTAADTHEKSHSFKDKTVKIAGMAQIMADTSFVAYGFAKKNFQIGSIGALGYTAGITGSVFGNPKTEKQLQLVERQLGDYLRSKGVTIPAEPTLENISQPNGIAHHAEHFLYGHPTQIMNACYGLMGIQFIRDGMHHKSTDLKVSGACLIAGALVGLMVKEKHADKDHQPHGMFEKAICWVQEKPMRTAGILFNINQAFLVKNALTERKQNPGQNAYMLKLLAVCGFVLCNTMLAYSSQGHGGGAEMDKETKDKLAEHAVRVIAMQPKETQTQLLEQVADYLATQPYIHLPAKDISAMLHRKMNDVIAANPDIAANTQQRSR